jgi:hypothetical protein
MTQSRASQQLIPHNVAPDAGSLACRLQTTNGEVAMYLAAIGSLVVFFLIGVGTMTVGYLVVEELYRRSQRGPSPRPSETAAPAGPRATLPRTAGALRSGR